MRAVTTNTLPPTSITTTSATLEAQGACNPNTTCAVFFHWHQTSGTWYSTAVVNHPCSGSSTCMWTAAQPIAGLTPGTNYGFTVCSKDGGTTYTCVGPTGTSTTMQAFTTTWLPPSALSAPTVSGTPTEYLMLSEQHASWTSSPTAYAYQWQDCNTTGTGCVNIPGATKQSYILGAGDVGHTVVVVETASNSGGSGVPSSSAPTAVVAASSLMATTGALTFDGNFESGIAPWKTGGGGAQCSNYGTPSTSPRLRGTFQLVTSPVGQGATAGEFSLPTDSAPSTYPLEACDLVPPSQPFTLGADQYLGLMVYVPIGWTIPNTAFYGVNVDELHFQNIVGAPITLQLHPDHVTVAIESGACNTTATPPGCAYRSNADTTFCPSGPTVTCLPHYYAIPPGALVQGVWNEIIMHVRWASDSTGQFQTWYRSGGQQRGSRARA